MKFEVKVRTSSSKNLVEQKSPEMFVVCTTKSPTKNEANESVVKLLAKYLGVAKSRIEIVKGKKSKNKTVEIS